MVVLSSRIHVNIIPLSIDGVANANSARGNGSTLFTRCLLVRLVHRRLVVNSLHQREAHGVEIEDTPPARLSYRLRPV